METKKYLGDSLLNRAKEGEVTMGDAIGFINTFPDEHLKGEEPDKAIRKFDIDTMPIE